jgi:hypothetical protein
MALMGTQRESVGGDVDFADGFGDADFDILCFVETD